MPDVVQAVVAQQCCQLWSRQFGRQCPCLPSLQQIRGTCQKKKKKITLKSADCLTLYHHGTYDRWCPVHQSFSHLGTIFRSAEEGPGDVLHVFLEFELKIAGIDFVTAIVDGSNPNSGLRTKLKGTDTRM